MDRKKFHSINSEPSLCPSSYGREYADPYLGHGIGPVAGYGVRNSFDYVLYDFSLNRSGVKWPSPFRLFTGENGALLYYAINNVRLEKPFLVSPRFIHIWIINAQHLQLTKTMSRGKLMIRALPFARILSLNMMLSAWYYRRCLMFTMQTRVTYPINDEQTNCIMCMWKFNYRRQSQWYINYFSICHCVNSQKFINFKLRSYYIYKQCYYIWYF